MKPDCTGKGDGLNRRELLALAGPGLFLGFGGDWLDAQEPPRLPARQGYPTDLNAYLRIAADGRVACFSRKVELGQGATTVLAQILAEELDVAYDQVDMVLGDTGLCPYDMGTFGSMNVPMSYGHSPVSPSTMSTWSYATSSSSARICASTVVAPCPSSTFPEKQVTLPSAAIRKYALRSVG